MSSPFVFLSFTLLLPLLSVVAIVVMWKWRHQVVTPGLKAILITGCDRGFGHMLAKRLDLEGYKVFGGCLDANSDGAHMLVRETSPKFQLLQLDVTNEDQIEAAKSTVVDLLMGHMLWAVVNNAGIVNYADFEWYPKANFKKIMDVNLMGLVNVTRAFLPLVRASKGRIINISSMAGRTALPGFTAYSASKFAVLGFSESLRREMAHFGVKVITLEPALYNTSIACPVTTLAHNETFWAMAEPGVKRDYGEEYFSSTQVAKKCLLHWANKNVNEVVDCLLDAITSRYPPCRYVPPLSLRILNDAMNMLFYSIQDTIIKIIMGVTTKPNMMCPQMVENCRMGRRRSYAT